VVTVPTEHWPIGLSNWIRPGGATPWGTTHRDPFPSSPITTPLQRNELLQIEWLASKRYILHAGNEPSYSNASSVIQQMTLTHDQTPKGVTLFHKPKLK